MKHRVLLGWLTMCRIIRALVRLPVVTLHSALLVVWPGRNVLYLLPEESVGRSRRVTAALAERCRVGHAPARSSQSR